MRSPKPLSALLVTLLIAAAVPVALLAPSADAFHLGPEIHGEEFVHEDLDQTLYLHCKPAGTVQPECARQDTERRLTGDRGPITGDDGRRDADLDDRTFCYTFATEADDMAFSWKRDFVVDEVTAHLMFDWVRDWHVEAELVAFSPSSGAEHACDTAGTVLGSDDADLAGPQGEEVVDFTFVDPSGPAVLPEGHNLGIRLTVEFVPTEVEGQPIEGTRSLALVVEHPDDDAASRLEVTGDLVVTAPWTHDAAGIPRTTFPLDVADDERQVFSTFVVDAAFGTEMLDLEEDKDIRARHAGNLVDLRTSESGPQRTIPLDLNPGRSDGSRLVFSLNRSWELAGDADPGLYTIEYRILPSENPRIRRFVDVTVGAGIRMTTLGAPDREVRPLENATFHVEARNDAADNLDLRFDATLGVADGWTVRTSPVRAVLEPGETVRVTVQVTPPSGASPGAERVATLTAEAAGRPDIEPVTRDLTARVAAEVRHQPSLLALDPVEATIAPGGSGDFAMDVVNEGTVRDTIVLDHGPLRDGWRIRPTATEVVLDPGERREVTFTVHTSDDERLDAEFDVEVSAASTGDADRVAEQGLQITMGIIYDFDIEVHQRVREVHEEAKRTVYRMTVTQRGNSEEVFEISTVDGFEENSDAAASLTTLPLAPGESGEVEAEFGRVTLSEGKASGQGLCVPVDGSGPMAVNGVFRETIFVIPTSDRRQLQSVEVTAICTIGAERTALDAEARSDAADGGVVSVQRRATAQPGENVTFPLRVSNLGHAADGARASVVVGATAAPDGWDVRFDGDNTTSMRLATRDCFMSEISGEEDDGRRCGPSSSSSLTVDQFKWWDNAEVTVVVPDDAAAGLHEVVVTASKDQPPLASDSVTYLVEVPAARGARLLAPVDQLTVAPGEAAVFNLVADNFGNHREDLTIELDSSGLPGDWTVRNGSLDLTVPPGHRRYVTVELVPPDDAAAGTEGSVGVNLSLPFEPADPPEGLTVSLNATLTARVSQAAPVSLAADLAEADGKPGTAVPFDVTVTNEGDDPATVRLTTSLLPEGFGADILRDGNRTDALELDAGASADVRVEVLIPDGVLAGSQVGVLLQAAVDGRPSEVRTLPLTATVLETAGVRLTADATERVTPAGTAVSYRLTVTNTGTARDVVDLVPVEEPTAGWSTSMSGSSLALDAKASDTVTLDVVPSADVPAGSVFRVVVTAVSRADDDQRSEVTLRTETLVRGVRFATQDTSVAAAPGETVTAATFVDNTGNAEDTFQIDVVKLPEGWRAEPGPGLTVAPGESGPLTLEVDVPDGAQQGAHGLTVQARSQSDPAVSATASVVLRIVGFSARDVDDDGLVELAVDRNEDPRDGQEAFVEPTRDQGIVTTVVRAGPFGDAVRRGYILQVQSVPSERFRFWDPAGDVVTDVVAALVLRPDSTGYLLDVDGDGRTDLMYDERSDRVLPAVSVEGRPAFLVDSDGDGRMDTYYDDDRGLTTAASPHPGGLAAVDSDGNGGMDRLVDEETGQSRAYTAADAVAAAAVQQTLLIILLLAAVGLAVAAWFVRGRGPGPGPGRPAEDGEVRR